MLTSSRRGIVYPNPTRVDTPDVPRDFLAVINALEIDVIYGQGTLAARPTSTAGTPGIQGRVYMATDQTPHAFYYDYGTGWDPVGALAAGAVTTSILANGAVTAVKLASQVVTYTAVNYSPVVGSDRFALIMMQAGITVTLPSDATSAFAMGDSIDFIQNSASQCTFVAGSGAVIAGNPGLKTNGQYTACTAIKVNTNTWVVVGNLST